MPEKVKRLIILYRKKFRVIIDIAKTIGYYGGGYIFILIFVVILFITSFKMIEGVLTWIQKDARADAIRDCKLHQAIQITLKPEVASQVKLSDELYFFSYVGEKEIVVFSNETQCEQPPPTDKETTISLKSRAKGFHILKQDDILYMNFSPNP